VPGQTCSTGSVTFWVPQGRTIYNGLLVKAQKRMSNHYQFTVSYALQNQNTVVAPTLDLNNYFATYGPNLQRHTLNIAALINLPWGLKLSTNTALTSRVPVEPLLIGPDLAGSGTNSPLALALSKYGYNCFAMSCSKTDLANAVATYNSTVAGTKDLRGNIIKPITLPGDYQFGDPKYNTDVRITKGITYKERYHAEVFAEVFNLFNVANLTGYSFNLSGGVVSTAFGQPTSRVGQVFGSGGPRAEQVGARISF
jgi:hypothetical protein